MHYRAQLSSHIVDILKNLANIEYEETSLEIFSECLKLNINDTADHQYDFVINTRFGEHNNLDLNYIYYNYKKLLSKGCEIFQQNPKKLFKIYCDII
jgi:hypothetical protein